jgi:hypothetical protein
LADILFKNQFIIASLTHPYSRTVWPPPLERGTITK